MCLAAQAAWDADDALFIQALSSTFGQLSMVGTRLLAGSKRWPLSQMVSLSGFFAARTPPLSPPVSAQPRPLPAQAPSTSAISDGAPRAAADSSTSAAPSVGTWVDPWVSQLLGVASRAFDLPDPQLLGARNGDGDGASAAAPYFQSICGIDVPGSEGDLDGSIVRVCNAFPGLPPGVILVQRSLLLPEVIAWAAQPARDEWTRTLYVQWPGIPCSVIGMPRR